MSEHENDPQADEHVEDLDVPEGESDEVKGGSLNFTKIEFKASRSARPARSNLDLSQFGDGSV